MSFIQVRDSDSVVMFVSKVSSPDVAGCTEYEEDYNGPFEWNTPEVTVYRHGAEDYQLTPPA